MVGFNIPLRFIFKPSYSRNSLNTNVVHHAVGQSSVRITWPSNTTSVNTPIAQTFRLQKTTSPRGLISASQTMRLKKNKKVYADSFVTVDSNLFRGLLRDFPHPHVLAPFGSVWP